MTAAFAVLCALVPQLDAQSSKKAASGNSSLIEIYGTKGNTEQFADSIPGYIKSGLFETPRFLIDGVSYEHSKKDKRNAKGWISIIIPFKTALSAEQPWLEDIEVEVNLMVPMINDRQITEWGVLTGKVKLAPVANHLNEPNKGYHALRVFVSPHVVSRYFAGRDDRKRFEKIIEEMPIQVTMRYGTKAYNGGRAMGREFVKICSGKGMPQFPVRGAKLTPESESATGTLFKIYADSPRTFFVVEDAILPASKTPWAWFEYDKQETTIDETRSK